MFSIELEIRITRQDYLLRYRAPAAQVLARSRDGRSVRLPASALQRFVTHDGIDGCFRIEFDGAGRLISVERV